MRTGTDDTPLIFEERVLDSVGVWLGETEIVDQDTWVGLSRRQRGVIVDDEDIVAPGGIDTDIPRRNAPIYPIAEISR